MRTSRRRRCASDIVNHSPARAVQRQHVADIPAHFRAASLHGKSRGEKCTARCFARGGQRIRFPAGFAAARLASAAWRRFSSHRPRRGHRFGCGRSGVKCHRFRLRCQRRAGLVARDHCSAATGTAAATDGICALMPSARAFRPLTVIPQPSLFRRHAPALPAGPNFPSAYASRAPFGTGDAPYRPRGFARWPRRSPPVPAK